MTQFIISNKETIKPPEYKTEPYWTGYEWSGGYSFKHFWGNCHAILGDLGDLEGVQQLCHHYYLQNGSLGALDAVDRIKRLIGVQPLNKSEDEK